MKSFSVKSATSITLRFQVVLNRSEVVFQKTETVFDEVNDFTYSPVTAPY